MEVKKSDIFDRWTIVKMKARVDANAKKELAILDAETNALFRVAYREWAPDKLFALMAEAFSLTESNAKIWENEAAIRQECGDDPAAKGKELPLAEIGRRALLIRRYNGMRVTSKQKIDEIFGEIPDVKVDHVSQG